MASHFIIAALLVVGLVANLAYSLPVPAEGEEGSEIQFQDATTEAPVDGEGNLKISGKSLNLNSVATILLLRNILGNTNTGINNVGTGLLSGINTQSLLALYLLGRVG